jgi:hypothetical protein
MRFKVAVAAASLTVVASVLVAIMIHRTLIYCSYLGGQPPPPCSRPTDYPLSPRLGIVAGGILISALIIVAERMLRHRQGPHQAASARR